MTAHRLASQLRRRQYAQALVPREQVDALSDEDIIDCYVTCPDCGKKQVEGGDLQTAISRASGATDFFRICNALAHAHGRGIS
jgi:hypothetical protein